MIIIKHEKSMTMSTSGLLGIWRNNLFSSMYDGVQIRGDDLHNTIFNINLLETHYDLS